MGRKLSKENQRVMKLSLVANLIISLTVFIEKKRKLPSSGRFEFKGN